MARLADIARAYCGDNVRTTVEQDLVLRFIGEADLPAVYEALVAVDLHVPGGRRSHNADTFGMAIGAVPSRNAPSVMDAITGEFLAGRCPQRSGRSPPRPSAATASSPASSPNGTAPAR